MPNSSDGVTIQSTQSRGNRFLVEILIGNVIKTWLSNTKLFFHKQVICCGAVVSDVILKIFAGLDFVVVELLQTANYLLVDGQSFIPNDNTMTFAYFLFLKPRMLFDSLNIQS